MGVENFQSKAAEGKRATKRARVLLAAKLQTKHGEIDARLRDLSRTGALVECHEVPKVGTEIVFVRGQISVPARVAWTAKDRVGLEFLYAIDEHEVLVQLGRGKPPSQSYRSPIAAPRWSTGERKIAEAWGVAVGLNLPEDEG